MKLILAVLFILLVHADTEFEDQMLKVLEAGFFIRN